MSPFLRWRTTAGDGSRRRLDPTATPAPGGASGARQSARPSEPVRSPRRRRARDWLQDFPNPSDFYLLIDGRSIQPTNNQNFSKVDDPFVQRELERLNAVPATQLDSVEEEWQRLDEYVARRAYVAVYGAEAVPKFFSDRVSFDSVFHPLYFNDRSTLSLR